jgi:peptidyl-tRNA hydrolase, PTH1 family
LRAAKVRIYSCPSNESTSGIYWVAATFAPMKFLIAGLGNIGPEYDGTRHNVGFTVVEKMAADIGFVTERYAARAELRHKGRTFILIKPATFMNLSGNAVRYWLQQEKIPIENMLVVTDDLALPFGKIRIRAKGSDGGHNGLKHITEVLGTSEFARLRFGISNQFGKGQQVDYVLGKWAPEEQASLSERIDTAAKACLSFGMIGLARTMNEFNSK